MIKNISTRARLIGVAASALFLAACGAATGLGAGEEVTVQVTETVTETVTVTPEVAETTPAVGETPAAAGEITLEQAKEIALAYVGEGTVTYFGDEDDHGARWEIEITRPGGSEVDVYVAADGSVVHTVDR